MKNGEYFIRLPKSRKERRLINCVFEMSDFVDPKKTEV